MALVTTSKLRKYLHNSPKDTLVDHIVELFNKFPKVKEFYQSKLTDNGDSELHAKYKKIIRDEFFPSRGFGKMRLSIARQAINDFKKICTKPNLIVDLMIYYVEMGVRFTLDYGDIDAPFYYSMESMYDSAAKFAIDNKITEEYLLRFNKILTDTDGLGWGFYDSLDEIYHQYFK